MDDIQVDNLARSARILPALLAAATMASAVAGPGDGAIAGALRAPDAGQREAALDRLISKPDASPLILRQLASLLDDADGYVAGKAATALGRDGVAAFATIDRLLAEGTAQQRWGATLALAQTDADIAPFLPQLTRQLSQDDERLVYASLAALARLQGRAGPALPQLQPLLTHSRPSIRWATLETLAAIGTSAHDLVPQVAPLLQDPAPEVRLKAAMALQRIVPPRPLTSKPWLPAAMIAIAMPQSTSGSAVAWTGASTACENRTRLSAESLVGPVTMSAPSI